MEETEFDEFYASSFRRVAHAVHAMVGDADVAQDCTQEAFVRAWQHRRRLDRADHPEAWVRTTAYRLAVSRWRGTVRSRRAPDRAVGPASTTGAPSEDHLALVAALRRIPEDQRRAIVLFHLLDLPIREIARETRVPDGTVKARLSRGRAALAALIDTRADESDGARTPGGTRHG